jgi:VanZ family protein
MNTAPSPRKLALAGRLAALLLAGVIAYFTLTPVPEGLPQIKHIDKAWHFLAFAALAFPLALGEPRRWLWAMGLAMVFGGAIELVQPFVNRHAEWADFAANSIGAFVGAALGRALHRALFRAPYV